MYQVSNLIFSKYQALNITDSHMHKPSGSKFSDAQVPNSSALYSNVYKSCYQKSGCSNIHITGCSNVQVSHGASCSRLQYFKFPGFQVCQCQKSQTIKFQFTKFPNSQFLNITDSQIHKFSYSKLTRSRFRKLKHANFHMVRFPDSQIFKLSNSQRIRSPNFKSSGCQIFKSSDSQICQNLGCSDLQVLRFPHTQMLNLPNSQSQLDPNGLEHEFDRQNEQKCRKLISNGFDICFNIVRVQLTHLK